MANFLKQASVLLWLYMTNPRQVSELRLQRPSKMFNLLFRKEKCDNIIFARRRRRRRKLKALIEKSFSSLLLILLLLLLKGFLC